MTQHNPLITSPERLQKNKFISLRTKLVLTFSFLFIVILLMLEFTSRLGIPLMSYFIYFISLLAIIVTSIKIANSFICSIELFDNIVTQEAEGNLTVQASVSTLDEMGLLSIKLNWMIRVLKDRQNQFEQQIVKQAAELNKINQQLKIERLQAEEALRESEARYRMLIDTIPYGILEVNTSGIITFNNRAYANMLGYSEGEPLRKIIWEFLHSDPQQQKELRTYLARLIKEQPHPIPHLLVAQTRSGKNIDIQTDWNYKRDKQGRLSGFIAVMTDITQRKQVEEKLHKLSRAVEQSPSVVVITDIHANIEYVNPKFTEITGYRFEEVIGQNPRILKSEETLHQEHQMLWETIAAGGEWRGEFHNKKKNGEPYWEWASISPITNSDGIITHFLAVKEDITERKKVEAKLVEERHNLEKMVEARTSELRLSLQKFEEANLHLEQANRTKSQFLSSISHELRTPLNAILGFADLLNEQFFGKLNEKQLGYVNQIENSGKHLLALINDLLDVAKIDAGAMGLELTEVSPDEFIHGTVAMTASQFEKKQITVTTLLESVPLLVTVDVRKCKQIMLNLLSNAVKYTPAGGQVEIRVTKLGDSQIQIQVLDTGIGIEPNEINNIFSEFYQANKVRDQQLGGSGIGLALTRRLVEMHGGEIGVESEVGTGSTFWFTLPLKQPSPSVVARSESEQVTGETQPRGHRILVVEDNETNLSMILDMLSIHHHHVVVAKNGQEALEQAPLHQPELILMDIRLPVLDGLETTRRLRNMSEFANTPIIALTANTGNEAKEHQIAMGCTEHLAKPIQSKELFAVLQRYLGSV